MTTHYYEIVCTKATFTFNDRGEADEYYDYFEPRWIAWKVTTDAGTITKVRLTPLGDVATFNTARTYVERDALRSVEVTAGDWPQKDWRK